MRLSGFRCAASVSRFVLHLAIVVLFALCWGGKQAAAQLPSSTPTPEVANLPAGVEVRFAADLPLEGGDVQWHLLRGTTLLPGDEPITVHQGVLVASAGSVLVSHQDARVDIVEQGRGLLLVEGKVVLPVGLDNAPQELLIAELVKVASPPETVPTETPDYVAPGTIAAGAYIVALVYVPESPDASIHADAVMEAAITPGLTIAEVDPAGGTLETGTGARWIVALFAPGAAETGADQGTGQGVGNGTGGSGMPTATTTIAPSVTPTVTATITPTATVTPTVPPAIPPTVASSEPPSGSGRGSDSTTLNPSNSVLTALDDDGDGLTNGDEAAYGTDPHNPDCDGDGLLDGAEVDQYGTYPLVKDSEGDFLDDYEEVVIYGTNPLDEDTDSDGVDDFVEIDAGTDPLNR